VVFREESGLLLDLNNQHEIHRLYAFQHGLARQDTPLTLREWTIRQQWIDAVRRDIAEGLKVSDEFYRNLSVVWNEKQGNINDDVRALFCEVLAALEKRNA
jgi:hypothetical protein